jgi:hypothetical protein
MLSLLFALTTQTHILEFDNIKDGKVLGVTKYQSKITQDGGKLVSIKMTFGEGDSMFNFVSSSQWDKTAGPILKTQLVSDVKGNELSYLKITFSGGTATYLKREYGKSETKIVKAPARAEIHDLSEFWFIRDMPKVGQKHICRAFDASSLVWYTSEISYLGLEEKVFGDKKVNLHHAKSIRDKRTTNLWFNDKGEFVCSESSDGYVIRSKSLPAETR